MGWMAPLRHLIGAKMPVGQKPPGEQGAIGLGCIQRPDT